MCARTLGSFATMACLVISTTAWSKKAAADEQAFKEHCGKCHARAASLARNLKGPTTEDRAATLAKFLQTHHAEDAKARTGIVDYLVGLSAQ